MNFTDHVKDQLLLLTLHGCCMMLLTAFLYATGYPHSHCLLILICWALVLTVWLLGRYQSRNKYFRQLQQVLKQTDQKYLFSELMPRSFRLEDRLYQELIRQSNKAVIEKIRSVEAEKKDYREYIESWVHEIKAPIATISMICEQQKDDQTRRILRKNQQVENYVDMALYYARSDEVYKDYLIREASLQQTAEEVLAKHKYDLIICCFEAQADCPDIVFTDVKWISFILSQLVRNAIKYHCDTQPKIRIYTEKTTHSVSLVVADNGIGIRPEDVPRIFEKGFTGANGRKDQRATGMGLYLCEKLCQKLGIKISAQSKKHIGTKIILEFPVSHYLWKLPQKTSPES